MNIMVVSQYFWPENFLINDLAAGLIERGHTVTVLTGSPNYPNGRFFEGYGYINRCESYRGAKVVRVPLIPRGDGGGVRLVMNYFSFAAAASILAPFLCKGPYDVIFVFEPSPITVGFPALVLKKLKFAPVLFWVQDLWPESLSATGAVKTKSVLSIIGMLVRFIYCRCDRILIQSKAFRDSIIQQGGRPDDVRYFPNSTESVFHARQKFSGESPSLPHGFIIMFAGNIGAAQDFGTIIAAAKLLKGYSKIHWVIVGDGRMREWAEKEILTLGLNGNFHFLGRHPVEEMPALFARADALLVTLKKEPIFALTIPSKIQAYLASGRPVVAAIDGEGARIIDEAGAGVTAPTENPEALARAVVQMYETPGAVREEMGARGRAYYDANFDRNVLLDKLVLWMNELVAVAQ